MEVMRPQEKKKLLDRLIQICTGFTKEDENFGICKNFVSSNLCFHRYLSVDSHKVTQVLTRLYEKFKVHSELAQGELLQSKISQFLSLSEFEKKDVSHTDTQYAIISFLLDMSNSPTSAQVKESPSEPENTTSFPEEQIDWKSYLLADLPELEPAYYSDSEDEWETMTSAAPTSDDVSLNDHADFKVNEYNDITEEIVSCSEALKAACVPRYWLGEPQEQLYNSTDLIHNWKRYVRGTSLSAEGISNDVYVTEYQVVRELLWLYCGATKLFLFEYDSVEMRFTVKDRVCITHATQGSLSSVLTEMVDFGTKLAQLRHFTSSCQLVCHTYQSFTSALLEYISAIDQFTTQLQSNIRQEKASATLLSVRQAYEKYHLAVTALYSIYTTVWAFSLQQQDGQPVSLAHSCSVLISKCNSVLVDVTLYNDNTYVISVILNVFLMTIRPYLDMIDGWLTSGSLTDPHKEFIFSKRKETQLDETFWETSVGMTGEVDGQADGEANLTRVEPIVPHLFSSLLNKITITGKSMEMLSGLGKCNLIESQGPMHSQSLHCEFIGQLAIDLELTGIRVADSSSSVNHYQAVPTETDMVAAARKVIHNGAHSLLAVNLRELDNHVKTTPNDHNHSANSLVVDVKAESQQLHDIDRIVASTLAELINVRHRAVSASLMRVLYTDCKLLHQLSSIKSVYLLGADTMYDFYMEIFDKIKHEEDWADSVSLNIYLQERLSGILPNDAARFSVYIAELRRGELLLPINAVEQLCIHYEVDWPFDVIFHSQFERDYNRIMQFLLQIKLAKYSLDRLLFSDVEKLDGRADECDVSSSLIHRLYVQRMRLLHLVNGIHEYFMTNIIETTQIKFEKELSEAVDAECLIQAHKHFLSSVYDRCFLHDNSAVIRGKIISLLNSAITFQRLWDDFNQPASDRKLAENISLFNEDLAILKSFVAALSNSRSLPHLEYLDAVLQFV